MPAKKRVILVTDGDRAARRAVETAARNVGGRVISASAGNPTSLSGEEILNLIRMTPHDPVLVMVDDHGKRGKGPGEAAIETLARAEDITVIGAVAVASDTTRVAGTNVQTSVDSKGRLVDTAVTKDGAPDGTPGRTIKGDTVDILDRLGIPVVVGMGDPGKMTGDRPSQGARLTTRAVEAVLTRWNELQASRGDNDGGKSGRANKGVPGRNGPVDVADTSMIT